MKIRQVVDHLEEATLAALLMLMTLLTFIQVILRYVFNGGFVWSLEATTYAFAALVVFGMSYGVRTRSHIAVDLFARRIPEGIRLYVELVTVVICIAYALLMFYGSLVFVSRLHDLGNMARDVAAPKWLLTATMPLGFALLALRFLETGMRLWKRGRARDRVAEGPGRRA